jgi:membrane protease YdiL (CAAX protease family)
MFFNGSLGEEAGWRGFALPRLQQRFSPLVASLILGFFWATFHCIYFFMNLRSESWYMFWIRLGDIPLAVLFTWLYNRTKGKSLLPVLLLHASMNATLDYLPRIKLTVYAVLRVVVLVVVFTDRMWRKNTSHSF